MNKLFLIILTSSLDVDKVINHLKSNGAISYWFYSLPNSIFVRSNLTSIQIQNVIQKGFAVDRIFIIHISQSADYAGIVPDNQVNLFNNK